MARRPRPIRKRPFVEPTRAPELDPADLVDDGLLLAAAGVRITVRNLIIVRALRDGVDFDEDWYVAAVKHEFRALAAEKRADAERAYADRLVAADRPGRASHRSDYRWEDAHPLDRRAAVLNGLAERLDLESEDDAAALALVRVARQAALDDIADSIGTEAARPVDDAEYLAGRAERMALVTLDLLELDDQAQRT